MERRITYDDGAQTVVETWGSSGPNIVCVHGITSSRKSWARFAQRFELAYRVHAYDQRGHGDAAGTTGPMSLVRTVSDLAEVVRSIGAPVDALVGHSWGGAVVLLGGLDGLAARVVAVDPMIHQTEPWRDDYVTDIAADIALDRAAREREFMKRYAAWGEIEIAGKMHAMETMSIEAIERLGSENHVDEGGWDLRETVANYPHPLLMFIAGQDSVIEPSDQRWLETHLGPNARIAIFPEDGHNLHRTNFDQFVADVQAFLITS